MLFRSPVAIVAGIFTALYQLELYPEEMFAEAIAQLGSTGVLVVITAIQTVGYAVFCGFFGYILADRTGLIKPLKFEKRSTIIVTLTSLVFGAGLFFADLGFNALMPEMPQCVQTEIRRLHVLKPHAYHTQADLPPLRPQGLLRRNLPKGEPLICCRSIISPNTIRAVPRV